MMLAKGVSLSDILNRLMFEKKIRVTELSRQIGLPQPTLHRIATGKSPNPHRSTLEPIANFFQLNVEQLVGSESIPADYWSAAFPAETAKVTSIPIISWEQIEHPLEIARVGCREIMSANLSDQCFGLSMNDSSMEPHFEQGSTLIFDPGLAIKDRAYALVKLSDSEHPIFRQVLMDGDSCYLKSLNPDLSAFTMRTMKEEDEVLGILVESRRNY